MQNSEQKRDRTLLVTYSPSNILINPAQKGLCFLPGVTESERNNIQSCRYQKDIKILADILVPEG